MWHRRKIRPQGKKTNLAPAIRPKRHASIARSITRVHGSFASLANAMRIYVPTDGRELKLTNEGGRGPTK
jgi:hypothetical protein